MHLRTRHLSLSLALALATPGLAQQATERVFYDQADPSGRLEGGSTELPRVDAEDLGGVLPAPVTRLTHAGAPAGHALGPGSGNRVDLVFVGDGYRANQLGAYQNHVSTMVAGFFAERPFLEYASYFEVHRVDVVSNESGVDNDPNQGVQKDTALDMGYWCSGIERLLCVNVGKAYNFANNAPDVDLVAAVANSSKYGGAGYTSSDLATAAGSNGATIEILLHEFGHALGDLADEYFTAGTTYSGGEPGEPNVSRLTASAMASAGSKWADWLGAGGPSFDGLHDTFEGGRYNEFGIYRPTTNSLMRSLGRPFNRVGIEAVLVEIYRLVDPIDASSDPGLVYGDADRLFVEPLQPSDHDLDVQWFLDDVAIPGATENELFLCDVAMSPGARVVSAQVVDNTAWVRDANARATHLTQRVDFDVLSNGSGPISSVCISTPNSAGPGALMDWSGSGSIAQNDLVFQTAGLPPGKSALSFFGRMQIQVPFGDGFRCAGGSIARQGIDVADAAGEVLRAFDLNALPPAHAISPGDLRVFQLWYRDPMGPGGSGFNLSDALRVTFCP